MSITHDVLILSKWINNSPSYEGITGELLLWRRTAKVAEEAGEAVAALYGALGENPRKGVTKSLYEVEDELFDVALTALGAVVSMRGNDPDYDVYARFRHHIRTVLERVDLEVSP